MINEYLLASDVARVADRLLNSRDSLPALSHAFGDEPMLWLGFTLSRLPAGDEAEMALVNVGEQMYDLRGEAYRLQSVARYFAAKTEFYRGLGDVPSRTPCRDTLAEFECELVVVTEYGYAPVRDVFNRNIERERNFALMMLALREIMREPPVANATSAALAYAAD